MNAFVMIRVVGNGKNGRNDRDGILRACRKEGKRWSGLDEFIEEEASPCKSVWSVVYEEMRSIFYGRGDNAN